MTNQLNSCPYCHENSAKRISYGPPTSHGAVACYCTNIACRVREYTVWPEGGAAAITTY